MPVDSTAFSASMILLGLTTWVQVQPIPAVIDPANPGVLVVRETGGPWAHGEAEAHGKNRAEADYASGNLAIEMFGMPGGLLQSGVDEETGIYVRERGCVIVNEQGIESEAYNARVRELIAERGLPDALKSLSSRYAMALSFEQMPPELRWQTVLDGEGSQPRKVDIGPYAVQLERMEDKAWQIYKEMGRTPPGWVSQRYTRCQIMQGEVSLGSVPLGDRVSVKAAYWEAPQLIVLKVGEGDASYVFYDVVHRREIWRSNPGLRCLKRALDEEKRHLQRPGFPS